MSKMHCGMCEHDWQARSPAPKRCPSCGSDEIETAEAAKITNAHNDRALELSWQAGAIRSGAYADARKAGFTPEESAVLADYLAQSAQKKLSEPQE